MSETMLLLKYGHKEYAVAAWLNRRFLDTIWDEAERELVNRWQKEWVAQDYWPTRSRMLQTLHIERSYGRVSTL